MFEPETANSYNAFCDELIQTINAEKVDDLFWRCDMRIYYNPTTGDTAKVNSDKADKDGDVWIEINGGMPKKENWTKFISEFKVMLKWNN